ncbi:hypothetical protein B484DRAFT_473031, partial [Ochromonadaceae sp. CCMP2298]
VQAEAAAPVPTLHNEAAQRRACYRESLKDLLVKQSLALVKTTRARPIAQTADEQQEELQARSRSKLTDRDRRNMLHSYVQREKEFVDSWTTSLDALDGLCPGEAVHSGEWVVHFCTTCQAEDAGEDLRSLVSHSAGNRPVLAGPGGRRLTPSFIKNELQGKTSILRRGKLRKNICNNEFDLQAAVDNLDLGRRLHRLCGAGAKTDATEGEDNYCTILFMLSFKITAMDPANRRIQLNGHWLDIVD